MNDRTLVASPEGVDLELPLAGLVSRMTAVLVDFLLLALLWLLLAVAFMGALLDFEEASVVTALLVLVVFVTTWGYAVAFELAMRGQTPGKRLMGLRVIREDGLPIGLRESALRNLCRILDMQPTPFYLVGGVAMVVDPRGRRLGDLVAGTLVISESLGTSRGTRAGAAWAARAERGQAHQAVRLPRGTLSARQVALIEQFLERRSGLEPERRRTLARGLAQPISALMDDAMLDLMQRDPEQLLEQLRALAQSQEESAGARPDTRRSGPLW